MLKQQRDFKQRQSQRKQIFLEQDYLRKKAEIEYKVANRPLLMEQGKCHGVTPLSLSSFHAKRR